MSKAIFRRRNVALAATALALLSLGGLAVAQQAKHGNPNAPRFLNGTYGFSLTQTCVRTPFTAPPANSIDPTTKQLLVNGEFVSGYGNGTLKFNRDGSVQLQNGLITEISAAQVGANQSPVTPGTQFGCDGNYTLQSDNKLNLVLVCETAPPAPGLRVLIEPVVFEGFLTQDRSINLGTHKRDIHTVTVHSGSTPVQQRQRICLQSLVLDKR